MTLQRTNVARIFALTAVSLFMTSLDNLVVITALPSIRTSLGADLADLEWTVNAYILSFAVLLLAASNLGDAVGRRKVFLGGMTIFTAASVLAATATTIEVLVAARALQGVGAAAVVPLSLTLLAGAVPDSRRGLLLGAWSGVGGIAIAIGPLVGGAVVQGISWQWIFWINVPIGIAVIALTPRFIPESRGAFTRMDWTGVALSSVGLFSIVFATISSQHSGWTSPTAVAGLAVGVVVLTAFCFWESRAHTPMLPLEMFRNRAFAMTNLASLLMFVGMFGSIFLLVQFLQTAQGYSPLEAGLATLPWTAMPALVAPLAGFASDRLHGGRILAGGLGLQGIGLAWIALVIDAAVSYRALIAPFVISGVGMGLFFAPVANLVLGAVTKQNEGIASGTNNAFREIGGVIGVAVLSSVFISAGSFADGQRFVAGLAPALWVGACLVMAGASAALAIPRITMAASQSQPHVKEEYAR
ncbi:MFS transporter [Nocardia coubleae]|uniref:MFS transporter n=1 Tax=Nocardia coubleae TaxID=356147 RepID=A0A846WA19_9NOCA|nr:MFS transporter [Nocardia coubleae]NKX89480.1 MFS transporter [Nocardia coubleae]